MHLQAFKRGIYNTLKKKIVESDEDIILIGVLRRKEMKRPRGDKKGKGRGREVIRDKNWKPIMEDEVILNPRDYEEFKEEDKIIVMAREKPDLSYLED